MNLTIKFISTVNTIGSQESTVQRLTKLSAAAGKFNLTIGTSIKNALAKAKGNPNGQPKKSEINPSNTKVITKTIEDCSPEDATLIADFLFNYMDDKDNSQKYTEAKANFDTCKRNTLAEFGVEDYEKLTAEERRSYAAKMIARRAPFKYTEKSIHIKYGDNQTIYSRTHRMLGTSHWKSDFYETSVDLAKLREKFTVSFRQTNGSGNQSQ